MYKLIYCYVFKLIEKKNPDPKFGAISFVWLTQLIHIAFVLAVLKRIFTLTYPALSETYFYNKLFFMPIAVLWLVCFYYLFSKRTVRISALYEGKNILTRKNSIIVFTVVLVPLAGMIVLLKK